MKRIIIIQLYILIFILTLEGCSSKSDNTAPYKIIAFSIKNAVASLNSSSPNPLIQSLAGINRVLGLIIDDVNKDVILIGIDTNDSLKADFNDLVTVLRSRILYNEFPLVSIDPDSINRRNKQQSIRFNGHIQNTHFGSIFLECDVLLKKYSLQLTECINEVPSYIQLFGNEMINKLNNKGYTVKEFSWLNETDENLIEETYHGAKQIEENDFVARYWFYPIQPIVAIRRGDVFLIRDLSMGVAAEEVFSKSNFVLKSREDFSNKWTDKFRLLNDKYPQLKYLKLLYDFTALANAIKDTIPIAGQFDCIKYLVNKYRITNTQTPISYKLEEVTGKAILNNGMISLIRVSGGLQFGREVKWINYGNYEVLKDIVLKTRPKSNSLYWQLPIKGWKVPNIKDLAMFNQDKSIIDHNYGCSVNMQSVIINPNEKYVSLSTKTFQGFKPIVKFPGDLKGITMKMVIDNSSYTEDKETDKLGKSIKNNRPQ